MTVINRHKCYFNDHSIVKAVQCPVAPVFKNLQRCLEPYYLFPRILNPRQKLLALQFIGKCITKTGVLYRQFCNYKRTYHWICVKNFGSRLYEDFPGDSPPKDYEFLMMFTYHWLLPNGALPGICDEPLIALTPQVIHL